MSRSKRKNFIIPNVCYGNSLKKWKQEYNRIFRRKSKLHLDTSIDENGNPIKDYFHRDVKKRVYADEWLGPADGFVNIEMLTLSEFNNQKEGKEWYYGNRFATRFDTYEEYVKYFKRKYISK